MPVRAVAAWVGVLYNQRMLDKDFAEQLRDHVGRQLALYPTLAARCPTSWLKRLDFDQLEAIGSREPRAWDNLNLGIALRALVSAELPVKVRESLHRLLSGLDAFLVRFSGVDGLIGLTKPLFTSHEPADFWAVAAAALFALNSAKPVLRFEAPIPGATTNADILVDVDGTPVFVEIEARSSSALDGVPDCPNILAERINKAALDKATKKYDRATPGTRAVVYLLWRPSDMTVEGLWAIPLPLVNAECRTDSGLTVQIEHFQFVLESQGNRTIPVMVRIGDPQLRSMLAGTQSSLRPTKV